jgi:hypothetical protein
MPGILSNQIVTIFKKKTKKLTGPTVPIESCCLGFLSRFFFPEELRLLARLRSLPTASCDMSARVPEIKHKCQLHFMILQRLFEMHYT